MMKGAYRRESDTASKGREWLEAADVLARIEVLHRQSFAPATPECAPSLPLVDEVEVRRRFEAHVVENVPWFRPTRRRRALEEASHAAARAIAEQLHWRQEEQEERQRVLDRQWQALKNNDPATIFETSKRTFEDNEVPVFMIDVKGDEIAVAVTVPTIDAVPDRFPGVTPTGRKSLKRMPKTLRNRFYLELVIGHLLVTVKHCFAVLPGIDTVQTVVLTAGTCRLDCLIAARFRRTTFLEANWDGDGAAAIFNYTARDVAIHQVGQARRLIGIDLNSHSEVATLVARWM